MKILLDTHIWAWGLLEPERIAGNVAEALDAPDTELWLSSISAWELVLLIERGRVAVQGDPVEWVSRALSTTAAREAPLTHAVALESRRLRLPHPDPADRFILATAKVYGLTLATADARLIDLEEVPILSNR